MADTPDLSTQIADAADSPLSVSTTSARVQAQSIPDLIAADRYLSAKAASKKKSRGIRFSKIIGPPQVSTDCTRG